MSDRNKEQVPDPEARYRGILDKVNSWLGSHGIIPEANTAKSFTTMDDSRISLQQSAGTLLFTKPVEEAGKRTNIEWLINTKASATLKLRYRKGDPGVSVRRPEELGIYGASLSRRGQDPPQPNVDVFEKFDELTEILRSVDAQEKRVPVARFETWVGGVLVKSLEGTIDPDHKS